MGSTMAEDEEAEGGEYKGGDGPVMEVEVASDRLVETAVKSSIESAMMVVCIPR